ncbi:MAG: S1/P1 nuclease [Chromatiales bacterium]|jgi:hypothetical protein|nr:S1/P1 nuclease [Gammaproteobacteria bacterium]MDH3915623.1 S1/P1 nuclease [Chromatiales bacterium]NCF60894.1 hypothetical protein [Gammaproteobacteria bacterium]
MAMKIRAVLIATCLVVVAPNLYAWDHPGHMTSAAIAFAEIEKARPDLIDKIGLLMLKHPDPAPFWVAAGDARGSERARRMFIEAARWPDDAKFTRDDRPTWHSARWTILADDAPPESKALLKARGGRPVGNAIEALLLNTAILRNPEAKPDERALALSWMMHVLGDIHQPLHVSDLMSATFPTGNAAGTLAYVWDPLRDSAMPLHILWDSNFMRLTALEEVDRLAADIMKRYPRSSLPELADYEGPTAFEKWARESHHVAVDWAYDIDTRPDPNLGSDSDRIIGNMVKYILFGTSPVDAAPAVPDDYWARVQKTVPRRLALAGYRMADVILAAADELEAERTLAGKVLEAMPRHGSTN